MMCSIGTFVFVISFFCTNAKPVNNSVELLNSDASKENSSVVENLKLSSNKLGVGDYDIEFKNIKVSKFNVGSMKLVNVNGAYKVQLDGVSGLIEMDATIKQNSKQASVHTVGDINSLEVSNYDVTIKKVGGQIKAEVTNCNVVIEDYLLRLKASGDLDLQNVLTSYVKKNYKMSVNYLSNTEICDVVRPEIQKLLDVQNLNEILG